MKNIGSTFQNKYTHQSKFQAQKIKMYTIGVYFKPIQMYIDIIGLHFKAKSLVYILSLKHKKWTFFFINFKILGIFEN